MEMEPAFLNSTDVMEKVIVPTERMSTNVVSYMITKIFVRNVEVYCVVGLPLSLEYYIISFVSKNVLRETMDFSVMMENAFLSILNAMVIETARMEAMKKIADCLASKQIVLSNIFKSPFLFSARLIE